jgi:DNA-binding CsgD family transcriptional regulator
LVRHLTLLTPTQNLIEIQPGIDRTMKVLIAGRWLGKAAAVVGDEVGQKLCIAERGKARGRRGRSAKANIRIPITFMTGHGDIPMTVRAMKGGAVDFLTKPFRDQEMLDGVVMAIERDRKRREADKIVANVQTLFETLTPREREILALVSSGLMNKQTAAELGLAEITVKIHRGHIMKKMGARSLADLIRMAETLGIRRAKPSGEQT